MPTPVDVLKRIEGLPAPRHLFVLPSWAEPGSLDRLLDDGYLMCAHTQRDKNGAIQVAMNLRLTPKAERLVHPSPPRWPEKAVRTSLALASMLGISLVVLYLA